MDLNTLERHLKIQVEETCLIKSMKNVFVPPQLILCERTTRMFLVETGKKILSSIIVRAQKVRHKDWILRCDIISEHLPP